jgi:catechol 2,3-dioxygenase-like lactoylglutathione lyase family enzyme
MKLDHFTIRTTDLDATRDFFTDAVGLTVGNRPPFPFAGYWLYGDGRAIVHLVGVEASRSYVLGHGGADDPADDPGADTGAVDHLAFRGDDHAATLARLAKCGRDYTERTVPGRGDRQIFVRGPHGLVVELVFPQ